MGPQNVVVIILLVSLMLQTGMNLNWENFRSAFGNYGLLSRALLANIVLVPLFALLVVRAFGLDEYIAIGIMLMAIAPGVPVVVRSGGRAAAGSLGFALALGFLMPTIAVVTAPLTARLLFPAAAAAEVPIVRTILSLVLLQVAPLALGMLTAARAPALAAKLGKPLLLLFALSIAALFVLLGPALAKSIVTVYGSYGIITAVVVVAFSLAIGWLLGGPDVRYRHTLAIGTALRNVGLASLIATVSFPGTAAVAMVLAYFIVQIVASAIAGKYFAHSAKSQPLPAS